MMALVPGAATRRSAGGRVQSGGERGRGGRGGCGGAIAREMLVAALIFWSAALLEDVQCVPSSVAAQCPAGHVVISSMRLKGGWDNGGGDAGRGKGRGFGLGGGGGAGSAGWRGRGGWGRGKRWGGWMGRGTKRHGGWWKNFLVPCVGSPIAFAESPTPTSPPSPCL